MKIATWNVNGIRARQAQVQDLLEREQPDVLCLQEIKASLDQLPVWLADIEGYWCYWHGGKGYSGVGLHVRKDHCAESPAFHHPPFDFEHRIVTVHAARGDRGVDLRAERRQGLRRQDAVPRGDGRLRRGVRGGGPAAGALRRPERGAHRHGRAPEGAEAARHRPAARGARAHRADHRPRPGRRAAHAASRQRGAVHVVGAVAQHEAAQHRLAARLRARASARSPRAPSRASCSASSARATTARSSRVFGEPCT